MYKAEQKKLLSQCSPNVWDLFKHYGAIVAGGAITSIFCNREINDIDVYFPSEEALFRTLATIYNQKKYTFYDDQVEPFELMVRQITQRSVMCWNKDEDKIVQLMSFRYFKSAEEIFNSFDFTACMGAYDCKTEQFVFHPDFFRHNSQRYLKFNTGTDFPIMSALRVQKYIDKGYQISKSEYLRVLFTCMNTNITSWKEAKEHIGGMYGLDMEEAFDENKEFSVEELTQQLSDIQESGVDLYTPNWDRNEVQPSFEKVAETLFTQDWDEYKDSLVKEGIIFNDSQYFYKW